LVPYGYNNVNQGSQVHGLRASVESDDFRGTILFLILVNALALGLEATPEAYALYATQLGWVFLISQVIFVAEIALRWWAAPSGQFFKDSWNRFDFAVVAMSLLPAIGAFALIARIFRVLRVVRIVSVGEVLWGTVLREDSGLRAVLLALLLLVLSSYVFALSGFHLFGESLPQWSSLALGLDSLARSCTPSGFATIWRAGGGLLIFHDLFYLSLISIGVNLGVSLLHKPRSAS
jgi:voltage-gated sodium channel